MTDAQTQTAIFPAIAILGAGSLGSAILSGVLASGAQLDAGIRVTTRTAKKAELLEKNKVVVALSQERTEDANRLAVRGAAVVIVAVKPAGVPALLAEIADFLEPGALVISVAAGVSIARYQHLLPAGVAVIRCMPNTPALVRRAVTGLSVAQGVTAAQRELAVALFSTVGTVVQVPESQLDALSTISGSGPAYVFYLIEQLSVAACEKGFSPEQARELVHGTFLGAVELLFSTGQTPTELRAQVTSPQGTTERAIAVLQAADLADVFSKATSAALARAKELAGSV